MFYGTAGDIGCAELFRTDSIQDFFLTTNRIAERFHRNPVCCKEKRNFSNFSLAAFRTWPSFAKQNLTSDFASLIMKARSTRNRCDTRLPKDVLSPLPHLRSPQAIDIGEIVTGSLRNAEPETGFSRELAEEVPSGCIFGKVRVVRIPGRFAMGKCESPS